MAFLAVSGFGDLGRKRRSDEGGAGMSIRMGVWGIELGRRIDRRRGGISGDGSRKMPQARNVQSAACSATRQHAGRQRTVL